jgi:ATP-dependent Clp protease ATP-binding subunit ClpA
MDRVQGEIARELERRFPPEFRNRIDQVVVFEPLTRDEVRRIAEKHLGELAALMRRSGKALTIEPEALDALVAEGYSLAYGARFLKRVVDDRIKLPLSRQWKEAHAFRAVVREDQIVVESVGPRLLASSDPDAIAV